MVGDSYRRSEWYTGQVLYHNQELSGVQYVRDPYRRSRRISRRVTRQMGGIMSRGAKQLRSDGNGNIETEECRPRAGEVRCQLPVRLELVLDQPAVGHSDQLTHGWNPGDRSLNIFVKEDDQLTFHRHPVAQSTDCIRGKVDSKLLNNR